MGQEDISVEGEVMKTLNSLKWHGEEEPNATPLQVLQRTICDIHDEKFLLLLP